MKIINCFIFLLFTLLISQELVAQTRFGLKGGLNLANANFSGPDASNYEDFRKNIFRYHVEGICIVPVNENFKFRFGLGLHSKGHKHVFIENGVTETFQLNPLYVQIPIIASYVNEKFHIGVGPYFGFGISGKFFEKTSGGGVATTEETRSIIFGNNIDDDLRSLDAGLQFEVGFTINYDFMITASYNLGLNNFFPAEIYERDGISGKFNTLGLSFGYLFPY